MSVYTSNALSLAVFIIGTVASVNLALNILSLQGILTSHNAQLTQNNARLLETLLDRNLATTNGTIRTAAFNISLENNHLIHELLENISKSK